MEEVGETQKSFALSVIRHVSVNDAEALRQWLKSLLDIAESPKSNAEKMGALFSLMRRSKIVLPLLKTMAREIKKHGWDTRTGSQRIGFAAAATSLAVFGGAKAGIAALGGAFAVPLWVVFGSGAMFARYLYENLQKGASNVHDVAREYDIDLKANDPER